MAKNELNWVSKSMLLEGKIKPYSQIELEEIMKLEEDCDKIKDVFNSFLEFQTKYPKAFENRYLPHDEIQRKLKNFFIFLR